MSRHKKLHEAPPSIAASKPCAGKAEASCSQSIADRIRVRAYEICEARNGDVGDATTDWTQAERELVTVRDAKH